MQPAAGASKDAVETKRLAGNEKERVMDVVENGCAVWVLSRDRRKKLGGQW